MISKGCEQCAKGGKMVLFVYGYCDQRDCFYCPLGENRKNVTDVYANERLVESDEDVLTEAHRMDALGVRSPAASPQKPSTGPVTTSELLKTSSARTTTRTSTLPASPAGARTCASSEAGLDEIRFHPPYEQWGDLHGTEWEDILYRPRRG